MSASPEKTVLFVGRIRNNRVTPITKSADQIAIASAINRRLDSGDEAIEVFDSNPERRNA